MLGTLTLLLAALPLLEASDAISPDAQVKALAATVRLHAAGRCCGTGTIVGKRGSTVYVLTAEHCLLSRNLEVELFTASSYPEPASRFPGVTVVASSKRHDLALLKFETSLPIPDPIPICPPSLAPEGKFDVMTIGCSGARAPTILLAKTRGTTWATDVQGGPWVINVDSVPGRSGGAMLDARGLLVGVCCRRLANDYGGYDGVYTGLSEIYALSDEAGLPWLYQGTRETHLPVSAFELLFLKIILAETLMMLMARKADPLPTGDNFTDTSIKADHARWKLLFFLIFNTLVLLAWQESAAENRIPIGFTIGLLLVQNLLAGWIGRPAGFGLKHPLVLLIPCQSALFLLIPTPTWHPQAFAAGYVFLGFAIRVMAAPTIAPQEAARARTDSTEKATNAEQTFAQPTALPDRRDAPVCIP